MRFLWLNIWHSIVYSSPVGYLNTEMGANKYINASAFGQWGKLLGLNNLKMLAVKGEYPSVIKCTLLNDAKDVVYA